MPQFVAARRLEVCPEDLRRKVREHRSPLAVVAFGGFARLEKATAVRSAVFTYFE